MVTSQEEKDNESTASESVTAKTLAKKTLVESATALKIFSFEFNSFLPETLEDISNTIWWCLTKEYPKDRGVRISYIPILEDIFETSLADENKPIEGIDIKDLEDSIVVSKTTQFTSLAINSEDQETEYLASLTEEKQQEQHPDSSFASQFSLPTETKGAEIPSSNESKAKTPSVVK